MNQPRSRCFPLTASYSSICNQSALQFEELDKYLKSTLAVIKSLDDKDYRKKIWEDKYTEAMKAYNNFQHFGYDSIVYPKDKDGNYLHPLLHEYRERLSKLFCRMYGEHHPAYTSEKEFTNQLQLRFELVADEYEGRIKASNYLDDVIKSEYTDTKTGFGSHTISSSEGWSTGDGADASLPDVRIPAEDIIYNSKSTQTGHTKNNGDSYDVSLVTKLNGIVTYLSFDSRTIEHYLKEYSKLFKTLYIRW